MTDIGPDEGTAGRRGRGARHPRSPGCVLAAALLIAVAAATACAAEPAMAAPGASNSATLSKAGQMRAQLEAAGFDNIVNLQQREGGTWSCRALRFGTTVRVEVDRDGRISIL